MVGNTRNANGTHTLPSTMIYTKDTSPVYSMPSTKLASRMPNASDLVKQQLLSYSKKTDY